MSSPPDPERTPASGWLRLGEKPGLCATCGHAKLNETRRGTAYLRCELAAQDVSFPRYPRLPVTECAGFEEDHSGGSMAGMKEIGEGQEIQDE